jgi:hypothetical protein
MSKSDDPRVLKEKVIRRDLYLRVAAKADVAHSDVRTNFVKTWYSRMAKRGQLGDRYKFAYFFLIVINSLAAASVPALIAAAGSSDRSTANAMRLGAAGLGVFIAVTTSVLGVVRIGARWRLYRSYSQELEEAGWDYLSSKDGDSGYATFVAEVTKARREYDRDYLKEVADFGPTASAPKSKS